jgi:hypothetical protein
MKRVALALILTCGFALSGAVGILGAPQASPPAETPPLWAFPVAPAAPRGAAPGGGAGGGGAAAAAPDTTPKSVPGSSVTLTLAQVRDSYNIPDWHPDGHPAMPEIVGHGRRPAVISCGYCHLPNG